MSDKKTSDFFVQIDNNACIFCKKTRQRIFMFNSIIFSLCLVSKRDKRLSLANDNIILLAISHDRLPLERTWLIKR